MNRTQVWILTLLLALIVVLPVQAASSDLEGALAWLGTYQQEDGGFTNGFSEGSDLGATVETLLAAKAAGQDPLAWQVSPLAYLEAQVEMGQDAAGLSRLVLGVQALGLDPRAFAGRDLVSDLLALQDAGSAQFGDSLYAHAYALLALHNAGEPLPQDAVAALLDAQLEDGSWAMMAGDAAADTNTTALAVQALLAAGEREAAQAALPYFTAMQNEDGGFPWQKPSDWGTDTDANSTAVVLQALLALGESPGAWAPGGQTPGDALWGLRDAATGGFNWQLAMPGANVMATAQAVQALGGLTLLDVSTAEPVAIAAPVPISAPAETTLPASGGLDVGPLLLGGLVLSSGLALVGGGLALRRKSERL
ncbi:MAG: hypothetical protein JXB35_03195 [Anaerolineae bacterium]|nr:hypothetical protein [Anaerolineae bacterium]